MINSLLSGAIGGCGMGKVTIECACDGAEDVLLHLIKAHKSLRM
jgi:hypothetical protein